MTSIGVDNTVTVACAVVEAEPLIAVSVYVVVTAGVTVTEPEVGCAPTPLSITTEVAPDVVHDRVADWPGRIVGGTTPKRTVGVTAGVEPAMDGFAIRRLDRFGIQC